MFNALPSPVNTYLIGFLSFMMLVAFTSYYKGSGEA
jgi:hypothetical protein